MGTLRWALVAAGLVALALAGCSSAGDPESTLVDGGGAPGSLDAGGGPPTSELAAGGAPRSDVQQRVVDIVSRLEQVEVARSEQGTVVTVPDEVLFAFDDDTVRPEAAEVLATIAEGIAAAGDGPVRVRGHTDALGDPAYNQGLSERRAEAVRAALVDDHGIDAGRVTTEGLGATEPVADNTHPDGSDNPEGRQRNRRVEVVIAG